MAKTIKEVSQEVLQEIGRLPMGQTANANQLKTVSDSYDGLYQQLFNDSLVDWSATDDIPEYATDTVIKMLSGRISGRFGVPDVWTATKEQRNNLRRELACQIASPYVPGETPYKDY